MEFELDAEQRAWREEIRTFLRTNVTPELQAEMAEHDLEHLGGEVSRFRKEIGDMGWFGLNWPAEFGGLGLGAVYQHLLVSEFEYWGVPGPDLTVTSVAPMIMRHGTQTNKEEFLPPIARGEMTCAVGYSEPNAGTDLASLKTRAVLDGEEWVINGSKIWNSMAQRVTHEWLCVRTDVQAPKHKGISVIIVPIDAPGVTIRPIMAWSDYRTNETFFDNVRVPATNLIGEVNRGWQYITGALDLERGALTNAGDLRRAVDDLLELAQLMGFEASSLLESGTIPSILVSSEKIFSSELRQRIADVGTQLLGPAGVLAIRTERAPAAGKFERLYRAAPLLRFGAGTNEVLRDVIAQRGHGLPSYGR